MKKFYARASLHRVPSLTQASNRKNRKTFAAAESKLKQLTVNLQQRPLALTILVSLWFGLAGPAFGFYEPSVQRWINRDPIQDHRPNVEPAHLPLWSRPNRDPNAHAFLANAPNQKVDPFGLFKIPTPMNLVQLCACAAIAHQNYRDMKRLAAEHPEHGGLVNLDKYYHCLTSCQMTRVCGSMSAQIMGNMKEWLSKDEPDSKEDEVANAVGRDCANAGATDCHDCCEAKGYRLWED